MSYNNFYDRHMQVWGLVNKISDAATAMEHAAHQDTHEDLVEVVLKQTNIIKEVLYGDASITGDEADSK